MSIPYGPPQQPYGQQPPRQPDYGPPPGYGPVVVPGARSYDVGTPPPYAVPADLNRIDNYRAWAIVAVLLSLGIGVLALIRSNEVDKYKAQGNAVLAKEAADSVRTLCIFAAIPGVIAWIAIVVGVVIAVS